MSAPALPRRVPGAVLAASAAEDCSVDVDVCHVCNGQHPGGPGGAFCEAAGDVFTPTRPPVDGPPVCFECGRRRAVFSLGTVQPTLTGGPLASAFPVCELCVGKVAADLPPDVDIFITRLPKEEN